MDGLTSFEHSVFVGACAGCFNDSIISYRIFCWNFFLIFTFRFWSIFRIFWNFSCCGCCIENGFSEVRFFHLIGVGYGLCLSCFQDANIKALAFCKLDSFQTVCDLHICEFHISGIGYSYAVGNDVVQVCFSCFVFLGSICCCDGNNVLLHFKLRIFYRVIRVVSWLLAIWILWVCRSSYCCVADRIAFICFLYHVVISDGYFCFWCKAADREDCYLSILLTVCALKVGNRSGCIQRICDLYIFQSLVSCVGHGEGVMDGFACFEHSVFVDACAGFLGKCIASYRVNSCHCIRVFERLTALEFHFYRIYKASVGNVCLCNFIGCCYSNSLTRCYSILYQNVWGFCQCAFKYNARKLHDCNVLYCVINIGYADGKCHGISQIVGFTVIMVFDYYIFRVYRVFVSSIGNFKLAIYWCNCIVLSYINSLAIDFCKNICCGNLVCTGAYQSLATFHRYKFTLTCCK